MSNHKYQFLICYDIREPRRLQKLQRLLRRHCLKLQASVYLFKGNSQAGESLMQQISQRIDRRQDDVRVYQLSLHCLFEFYGLLPWPKEIFYADLPVFRHQPLIAHAAQAK